MAKMYGHVLSPVRVSTNHEDLMRVAENQNLSKKDLRLLLCLFCQLETDEVKKIDKKIIAEKLGMSKKDVENSLENLMEQNIIDKGVGTHVNGYYFTYSKKRGMGKFDIFVD